jgi:hypothetical protein
VLCTSTGHTPPARAGIVLQSTQDAAAEVDHVISKGLHCCRLFSTVCSTVSSKPFKRDVATSDHGAACRCQGANRASGQLHVEQFPHPHHMPPELVSTSTLSLCTPNSKKKEKNKHLLENISFGVSLPHCQNSK